MNLAANINLFWESWAQSPLATRLASTLLHFVWQGAALGAAAFLLHAALKRARPQIRYVALLDDLRFDAALDGRHLDRQSDRSPADDGRRVAALDADSESQTCCSLGSPSGRPCRCC